MRISFFLVALFLLTGSLASQTYFTAGGLRVGTSWGLTLQQRLAEKVTGEIILNNALDGSEFLVTGLGELHHPVLTKRLNIYTGAGLHVGSRRIEGIADRKGTFGVTAIGGAELTLARLVVSYDFKPALHLTGQPNPFSLQTGLSVRYVFVKNGVYKDLAKSKKKRRKARQKAKRRKAKGTTDAPWWKIWEQPLP